MDRDRQAVLAGRAEAVELSGLDGAAGSHFAGDGWIADGDLGPYDAVGVRLGLADAVVVLDVAVWRCAWRSLRRSREHLDYWRWLLSWHRRWRPRLLEAVAAHPDVELFVVKTAVEQRLLVERLASSG